MKELEELVDRLEKVEREYEARVRKELARLAALVAAGSCGFGIPPTPIGFYVDGELVASLGDFARLAREVLRLRVEVDELERERLGGA